MPLQFLPFAADHLAAVRAFNERMRTAHAPTGFLIAEEPFSPTPGSPVQSQQVLAMANDAVNGSVIQVSQPAWLQGREVCALNFQSPLSEGIIDRRHNHVAAQLVRYMQAQADAAFIIGMGSPDNPLPRLLKASGWSILPVPFLFRVHRYRAFFRELGVFRRSPLRRIAAQAAALSGVGAAILWAMQRPKIHCGASVLPQTSWDSWADELWEVYRPLCTFAVDRSRRTLEALYPSKDPRLTILLIQEGTRPIGWSVVLETRMQNSRYFGSLRIAAILDCVSLPSAMPTVARAIDIALAARHAELVFVNHSHSAWIQAFKAAGFLSGPSNYLLGMSKRMSEAVRSSSGGESSIHATRGDGDGRIHLA